MSSGCVAGILLHSRGDSLVNEEPRVEERHLKQATCLVVIRITGGCLFDAYSNRADPFCFEGVTNGFLQQEGEMIQCRCYFWSPTSGAFSACRRS